MAWLARTDWTAGAPRPDYQALNDLANDARHWGGDVNAGGYKLSNLSEVNLSVSDVTDVAAKIHASGVERLRLGFIAGSLPANNVYRAQVLVDGNGSLLLSTRTNNPSQIRLYTCSATDAVERVRVTSDGYVGLGILPNPDKGQLSVVGSNGFAHSGTNIRTVARFGGNANNAILFDTAASGPNGSGYTRGLYWGFLSDDFGIWRFNNTPALVPIADFYIDTNGRVGIGKSTLTAKLAVVGLDTHADNTTASGAGKTAGDLYRTASGQLMVVF